MLKLRHVVAGLFVLALWSNSAAAFEYRRPPSVLAGQYHTGSAMQYGFGVPTYRWGWFGASYRGRMNHHRGYYGDRWEWSRRCGY